MHSLLLVTLKPRKGWTWEDAAVHVEETLPRKRTFKQRGSDWHTIGGRWSGLLLADTVLKKAYEIAHKLQEKAGVRLNGPDFYKKGADKYEDELRPIVRKAFKDACPRGYKRVPLIRSSYSYQWDDALPVNQELYDSFLSLYEGKNNEESWDHADFLDLDGDAVSKDFIGKKWVVVVDYHF